jgi:hypothetical protein
MIKFNEIKKEEESLEYQELVAAVKDRGIQCEICDKIPEPGEQFQLRLINDKLTCGDCEDEHN